LPDREQVFGYSASTLGGVGLIRGLARLRLLVEAWGRTAGRRRESATGQRTRIGRFHAIATLLYHSRVAQLTGYAIVKLPALVQGNYAATDRPRKNAELLGRLRTALSFVNPHAYRGIDRQPIGPYPGTAPDIVKWMRKQGLDDEESARLRMTKRAEPPAEESEADDDLIETLEETREVFGLLQRPQDYEVVRLTRGSAEVRTSTLGFDVGYWGGDHFSIVADCSVMPRGHPPDPRAFDQASVSTQNRPVVDT
jgi:hypothetical protein